MSERNRQLINLFMRLEGLMHRHMMAGRQGRYMNPHRGQGRVLSILKLKPEITQKELTYLLDMSKQALGELLNKLEACGYITRTPSESDGRVMLIKLTEKGKAASEEMDHEKDDTEDLFQCLTEEEQKNLEEYLERLIDAWPEAGPMDRRAFGFERFHENRPFRR